VGALQASWSTQGTVYTALAIQPDGCHIASGNSDRVIRILDSESGAICSTWQGHTHTIEALRFSAKEIYCDKFCDILGFYQRMNVSF